MAERTGIEWTDATFNPWIGCAKVSPACDHCYAEVSTPARTLGVTWGAKENRHRTSAANWKLPLRWNAQHDEFFAAHGRRRRVFCASLADVFDNQVDPAWRADLFHLIESTPNLDWLLLTKRIGNVTAMVPEATDLIGYGEGWQSIWGQGAWPENVWLGATICNQEEADRDIPKLLAVPARVRFLSMEPLLGPVDLTPKADTIYQRLSEWYGPGGFDPTGSQPRQERRKGYFPRIDWVIVGGESGTSARPMHLDWARSLRDQCAAASVPFLFKQHGEWMPTVRNGEHIELRFRPGDPTGPLRPEFHEWPDGTSAARVGKKAAGRLLDGVQHDGFPEIAA